MTARRISLANISRTTIFLTVALAILCRAAGRGDPASVLVGGVFSVVNLHLIRLMVSRLMSPVSIGPPLSSVVVIKLLVLATIVAVALKRLPIEALSFVTGSGTLFVAIVLEALLLGHPAESPEDSTAGA
jgi:hypothetical protein